MENFKQIFLFNEKLDFSIQSITLSGLADILIILICGFVIKYFFGLSGQRWVKTFSFTAISLLLPLSIFIITKVIAGNIALSLGMVGALSIVRFRNPVKSPLELVLYFIFITLGISGAVSIKWTLLLTIIVIVIFLSLIILKDLYNKYTGRNLFEASFNEGNTYSSIKILSLKKIDILEKNKFLSSIIKSKNDVEYRLISNKKDDIENIYNDLKKIDVLEIEVNYN